MGSEMCIRDSRSAHHVCFGGGMPVIKGEQGADQESRQCPMTEETSFSQPRDPTPRIASLPRPPRGIRTLVAGRYPEVSMTEAEIREKLPHSPRTPPHLLPPSMSRTQASLQLRPRNQSTPNAVQDRAGGMAADAARLGGPSFAHSPIRAHRPLPGNAESRNRSSLSGTCLLYTSPSPRDGLLSRMPSSA